MMLRLKRTDITRARARLSVSGPLPGKVISSPTRTLVSRLLTHTEVGPIQAAKRRERRYESQNLCSLCFRQSEGIRNCVAFVRVTSQRPRARRLGHNRATATSLRSTSKRTSHHRLDSDRVCVSIKRHYHVRVT
jgi:hypothetical protein